MRGDIDEQGGAQPSSASVDEPGQIPPTTRLGPKTRNLLIVVGDVIGVAVLIGVLAIVASHGTALDFMVTAGR